MRGGLAVLLGGRAAERAALNRATSGASDDLNRATAAAERMVRLPFPPPFFFLFPTYFWGGGNRATSGVSDDLNRATAAAERMVRALCACACRSASSFAFRCARAHFAP